MDFFFCLNELLKINVEDSLEMNWHDSEIYINTSWRKILALKKFHLGAESRWNIRGRKAVGHEDDIYPRTGLWSLRFHFKVALPFYSFSAATWKRKQSLQPISVFQFHAQDFTRFFKKCDLFPSSLRSPRCLTFSLLWSPSILLQKIAVDL